MADPRTWTGKTQAEPGTPWLCLGCPLFLGCPPTSPPHPLLWHPIRQRALPVCLWASILGCWLKSWQSPGVQRSAFGNPTNLGANQALFSSNLTHQSLSFFLCNMGMLVPTSWGAACAQVGDPCWATRLGAYLANTKWWYFNHHDVFTCPVRSWALCHLLFPSPNTQRHAWHPKSDLFLGLFNWIVSWYLLTDFYWLECTDWYLPVDTWHVSMLTAWVFLTNTLWLTFSWDCIL